MGLLTLPGVRQLATTSLRALASTGLSLLPDPDEVASMVDSLKDARAGGALRRVVSSLLTAGQKPPLEATPGSRSAIA